MAKKDGSSLKKVCIDWKKISNDLQHFENIVSEDITTYKFLEFQFQ